MSFPGWQPRIRFRCVFTLARSNPKKRKQWRMSALTGIYMVIFILSARLCISFSVTEFYMWILYESKACDFFSLCLFFLLELWLSRIWAPSAGYSYPVDWWSLGIVAYEMRAGIRPFTIHSSTPLPEVRNILHTQPHYPSHWSESFVDLISKVSVLCIQTLFRFCSLYLFLSFCLFIHSLSWARAIAIPFLTGTAAEAQKDS